MSKIKTLNFGKLSVFADNANYSVTYFKRVFAKTMPSLGRLSYTQGKPALRCTESFVIGAKNYAKSMDSTAKGFFIGQDGLWLDAILGGDFVQFGIRQELAGKHGAQIYAHSARIDGRIYFIESASAIELGDFYNG